MRRFSATPDSRRPRACGGDLGRLDRRDLLLAVALATSLAAPGCRPTPLLLDPNAEAEVPQPQAAAPNTGRREPPPPTVLAESKRRRWAHAPASGDLLAVPGRERSEHGSGAYERTVQVDRGFASYLAIAGLRHVPEGTTVLERLHPVGGASVDAVFAMRKMASGSAPWAGDWEFAVLDPLLRVAVEGDLSACARCHLEAPHDGLFGPPGLSSAAPGMK